MGLTESCKNVFGIFGLPYNAIRDVATSSLRVTRDFNDLKSGETVVASNGIVAQDAGQLALVQVILVQQLLLFLIREQSVLRDELVLRNVDQQFRMLEKLKCVFWGRRQVLFRKIRNLLRMYNNSTLDRLGLHELSSPVGIKERKKGVSFCHEKGSF